MVSSHKSWTGFEFFKCVSFKKYYCQVYEKNGPGSLALTKTIFFGKEDPSFSYTNEQRAKNVWYWLYRNETHRNDWSNCTNNVLTLHLTLASVSGPLWPLFEINFIMYDLNPLKLLISEFQWLITSKITHKCILFNKKYVIFHNFYQN